MVRGGESHFFTSYDFAHPLLGEIFHDCSIGHVGVMPAAGLPVSFTTPPHFCPNTPVHWAHREQSEFLVGSLSVSPHQNEMQAP